jgi:hypothetical protein
MFEAPIHAIKKDTHPGINKRRGVNIEPSESTSTV